MASPPLPVGTQVLIGIPGVSCPDDWWFAEVLWADGAEVLMRQSGIAGATPHNALHDVNLVRAVGDGAFLAEFKRAACEATASDRAAVDAAERALGRARDAVWTALRAIGADRPGVESPKAKADRRRARACQRIGHEEAAQHAAR